ncbi:uncharacterized protein LOC111370728 [Olea europaea var. sylvestris]|uniref:uncharacterized protein LOC111370728 n=1 Tax=Olea europaea var. sylvestris TaxID=158386 RepID=UPI000C1D4069|nr:uncharacterized protein LOC111370728 [Olea europaea var. sylvestris]
MVNKVFGGLIGNVIEAYVDYMVVKSIKTNDHVADLQKVYDVAQWNTLKFNPKKCIFSTAGGKFMGFMITRRGIEANPNKIQAILEMKCPISKKEVQRLIGQVAASNRFMSWAADKYYHFFKHAVNAVLVKEFPKAQKSVYYVSQALKGSEIWYGPAEQLVFALIVVVSKLRLYFHSHTVQVMTDQPIKQILHQLETFGRMLKWEDVWKIFVDASPHNKGSVAGIIMIRSESEEFKYSLSFRFPITNNDVTGEFEATDGKLVAYLMKVRDLRKGLASFKITKLNILDITNIAYIEHKKSWMDPIIDYLVEEKLLEGVFEARRLKIRGFTMLYLMCLLPIEAREVLLEIRAGICDNHQGTITLTFKALR